MRAGLGAIQQTLTPEAAGVLNQSIAEAGRRNHGQTTPLHVAATLLASPSGFLRQACICSHPNSSHPLQCRALELCFSVALERLATAQNTTEPLPGTEPPVSNALLAALKRAQANQRRGGAEPQPQQQQPPLLAVKVELDQLIISILDDPSVSRVMREAGFSSPAVKATIEQSVAKSTPHQYNSNTTPFLLRLGNERLLGSPVESMNPVKAFGQSMPVLSDAGQRSEFCPQCSENYERELVKLAAVEKSLREATRSSLPPWLENAKLQNDDHRSQRKDIDGGVLSDQKTRELRKKWRDTCLHLHPNFHQKIRCHRSLPPVLFMANSHDSNLLAHSMFFPPKLPPTKPLRQLNTDCSMLQHARMPNSPPGSPVRTDLVLGRKEEAEGIAGKVAEDLSGCICSDMLTKSCGKFSDDADTYKKLLKGLMDNAWWQEEAASAVASAITKWKLGNGKRLGSRGDIWLLFAGPDRVGKKKMASVLGEHVFGASPVMISLGTHRDDEEEANVNTHGKTVIDQFVEVVQRNPFSVIMLEDVDETDGLVQGNVQRAIESGRITDTHGREVSLGNAVFVLTGDWSRIDPKGSREGCYVDELKVASVARGDWQLRLVVHERSPKRSASWLHDEHRLMKARKEVQLPNISLDLSLAPKDDDNTDGSDHNSSDVTVDHEDELDPVRRQCLLTSVPRDLINNVDEFVVFKPVDSVFALREIKKAISLKLSSITDDDLSIEVEDDVLEKILGGLWHDQISLNEWIDRVLAPTFDKIKARIRSRDGTVAVIQVIVMEPDSSRPGKTKCSGEWLPSSVFV